MAGLATATPSPPLAAVAALAGFQHLKSWLGIPSEGRRGREQKKAHACLRAPPPQLSHAPGRRNQGPDRQLDIVVTRGQITPFPFA